jgi:hypothetical protein
VQRWNEVAKLLERGKFDALFLADVLGVYDVYRGSPDAAIANAVQVPVNALLLIPAMAYVTSNLGFGVTCDAINIMGIADTLKVQAKSALGVWNAPIDGHKGSADRHYCKHCGTPLWVSDERWPELVHPFASAIDTELPKPPSSVHLLLRDKASWVEPQIGPSDECFDGYPELSIEDWHKKHKLWIK